MHTLLPPLFELLFTGPERPPRPASREVIGRARPEAWDAALDLLSPHKVFPLLTYRLAKAELLEDVPVAARERLTAFTQEVRTRNAQLLLTLARVLRAAQQKGQEVLLLKGILFADSYYPDPATRPMSDLDLVAAPGHSDALFALLEESGFRPSLHHPVQDHSVTFMNREGAFCDAHRGLPLFAGEPWSRLTRPHALTRVHGVEARALEPSAMVAHLAAHMTSHEPDIGYVLLWFVDLALVLRKHGSELEVPRVRALAGGARAWALLLRIVRLLEQLGEQVPPALAREARLVPPLALGAAMRKRRLTPWGLPAPLGWVRLAAHHLGLHRSERRPPERSDLLLWPIDELASRVSLPLARIARR